MSEGDLRFKRETLGVAVLLCLGSLFILYPFMDAVILAIATSYILRFTHRRINKWLNNEFLSSLIIISGVGLSLVLGLYLFINNFAILLNGFNSVTVSIQNLVVNFVDVVNLSESFKQNIQNFINSLSQLGRDKMISVFAGIPTVLVHLVIFTVTSIYLYKDGPRIEDKVSEIVENLPEEERKIFESLIDSIDYIFKGVFVTQFLVAAILGLIAAVGFHLISMFTSPMPLIPLWSVLIGIAALLPLVANFMIYVPLSIYYFITGAPLKGGLIAFFGISILQVMPEVFLRPYIGSRRMNEHPLIIFTGFIAGPLTLGLKGIILGPLILILTKEFVNDYATLVSE